MDTSKKHPIDVWAIWRHNRFEFVFCDNLVDVFHFALVSNDYVDRSCRLMLISGIFNVNLFACTYTTGVSNNCTFTLIVHLCIMLKYFIHWKWYLKSYRKILPSLGFWYLQTFIFFSIIRVISNDNVCSIQCITLVRTLCDNDKISLIQR